MAGGGGGEDGLQGSRGARDVAECAALHETGVCPAQRAARLGYLRPSVRTCASARRACCLKPPRAAAQMPKAQQDYYYSYARQNFVSFSDEDDPERINFLIEVVCMCVCERVV